MKTKLIMLLFLVNSLSFSQTISSIGFKCGVSISNQYWEYVQLSYLENFNIKTGYYGVLTADFLNKEYWAIMADVGFYQSNNTTTYNPYTFYKQSEQPTLFNFKFSFLTFSPSLKVKVPIKYFTPYIFIGPRIDYYSTKYSNSSYFYPNSSYSGTDTYFSDQITKKPIYGFNVGEGISYQFKRFSILAEYKFMYSFTYIIDNPAYDTYYYSSNRVKTNAHIISLGLKYNFTKK